MIKTDLLRKITGTEEPRFVNEREYCIIDKCLVIINDRELELYERNSEYNELEKKYNALLLVNKINNQMNGNPNITEKKKYINKIMFEDKNLEDKNYSEIMSNHLNSED
jgi:hypothetical protein